MEVCTGFESASVPSSSATATMLCMTHGEYLQETNGFKSNKQALEQNLDSRETILTLRQVFHHA